eukprot:6184986-Pleurochrysis_carterae.AAC.1
MGMHVKHNTAVSKATQLQLSDIHVGGSTVEHERDTGLASRPQGITCKTWISDWLHANKGPRKTYKKLYTTFV